MLRLPKLEEKLFQLTFMDHKSYRISIFRQKIQTLPSSNANDRLSLPCKVTGTLGRQGPALGGNQIDKTDAPLIFHIGKSHARLQTYLCCFLRKKRKKEGKEKSMQIYCKGALYFSTGKQNRASEHSPYIHI